MVVTDAGGAASTGQKIAFVCASHAPRMIDDAEHVQGPIYREAILRARTFAQDFDPDLVVYFAPEHLTTLKEIVPAFTLVRSAMGIGDWGLPAERYPVDEDAVDAIAEGLLGEGFDIAVARHAALDHAFAQTWQQLFGTWGHPKIVPIVINCAQPPLPMVERCSAFGHAIRRHIGGLGNRILFVASGGLSHDPPIYPPDFTDAQKRAFDPSGYADKIDPTWDRAFLQALTDGAPERLDDLVAHRKGRGTEEIRCWLAALAAAGEKPIETSYEPVPQWVTGMGVAFGA